MDTRFAHCGERVCGAPRRACLYTRGPRGPEPVAFSRGRCTGRSLDDSIGRSDSETLTVKTPFTGTVTVADRLRSMIYRIVWAQRARRSVTVPSHTQDRAGVRCAEGERSLGALDGIYALPTLALVPLDCAPPLQCCLLLPAGPAALQGVF